MPGSDERADWRLYPNHPGNGFVKPLREGCHYPGGSSSIASNSPVSGFIRPRRSFKISNT
jgi:hypothetical protein